jgi:hypothetical protein
MISSPLPQGGVPWDVHSFEISRNSCEKIQWKSQLDPSHQLAETTNEGET